MQNDPGETREPNFGELFADVPLFREIQRVMSFPGPINWELARQVGIATASWGEEDPAPTAEDTQLLETTVRAAELHVSQFTGLAPPSEISPVRAVRRTEWVEASITGLKELLEPAAVKIGEAMAKVQPEDAPPEAAQFARVMLGQVSPLLLGGQVGAVLGYLGQRVLGQFDIAVPRSGPGALYFVVPNIARFEREWSLPVLDFRGFVALHEVTHRFEFARPWVRERFLELVKDYVSTLELDLSGIQERVERLDMSDPEALQRMFGSEEDLFGVVLDDEQRIKLGRIQAFMAAAEGYGDHVSHEVGAKMLSSYGRIDEALRRHREDANADPVFERLLGIEMKREQYRLGRAFCERVVELTDESTLARMWESPETLPSMPELEEPRLWLARVA